MKSALWHGGLNVVWFAVFGCFVLINLKSYPDIPPASILKVSIKAVCIAGLFLSNYLGGQLILKYKVVEEKKHQITIKNEPK
jgi:hypothetical protein